MKNENAEQRRQSDLLQRSPEGRANRLHHQSHHPGSGYPRPRPETAPQPDIHTVGTGRTVVRKEGLSWLLNLYAGRTRTTTTPIASKSRVISRHQENARARCTQNRTITAFITARESRTPAGESKAEHTPNVHTAGTETAFTVNRNRPPTSAACFGSKIRRRLRAALCPAGHARQASFFWWKKDIIFSACLHRGMIV